MLELQPKRWFSWDFDVRENDIAIAQISISSWRERGEIFVQDTEYKLYRDGLTGPFVLEADGIVFASALKESAFRSSFVVELADRVLQLRKASILSRSFVLIEDDDEIGHMHAVSAFSRKGRADFPETLPLAVQVFLVWLILIMWRRESDG
jgi:hypothetical protein